MLNKISKFTMIVFFLLAITTSAIVLAENNNVPVISSIRNVLTNDKDNPEPDESSVNLESRVTEYNLDITLNQDFKKIVDKLRSLGLEEDKFYELIDRYVKFISIYQPGRNELNYINSLIIDNGYELDKVLDVYYFWLDTDEDISLIQKIYNMQNEFTGQNWIENAFNKLMENKSGVLSKEDVKQYLDKGVSMEDIATANILSRKGKFTIQQILEKQMSGEDWIKISDEIQRKCTKQGKHISKGKYKEYPKFENSIEILDAIFLSRATNEDMDVLLEKVKGGEKIRDLKDQYLENRTKNIFKTLKNQGLMDLPKKIKEKNQKSEEYLEDQIKQRGLKEEHINKLHKEGYSNMEILNIAEKSNSPDEVIKIFNLQN